MHFSLYEPLEKRSWGEGIHKKAFSFFLSIEKYFIAKKPNLNKLEKKYTNAEPRHKTALWKSECASRLSPVETSEVHAHTITCQEIRLFQSQTSMKSKNLIINHKKRNEMPKTSKKRQKKIDTSIFNIKTLTI